ncbi:MAG: RagB/SusD family nutrient uptake outer membrane protein, partial [Prevotella sp.]|nr:RagB/SusD family nutrient uptake outer membrane protein [Prevotella sp.]
ANAAKYARMAIDASGASPVTAAQWEDPTSGFAVANQAWMWYISYDAENMRNLANFTGWISGEADWGYSSLTRPSIDKSLFDKISDTDFRKTTFLHPDKYAYYDYKTVRDKQYIEEAPACLSLKFRCKGGDWENYATGGSVDVPIMRVEEMYLIEAEATAAAGNLAGGVALLNNFMQNYRDPNYNCKASDNLRDFQLEVLTQMRIEFWGEGNAFPSAKRLKPGVMQNYDGTNAPADIFKINCQGIKPIWNLVIPISELNNNKALQGFNNPNPTQSVTGPSPVGEYAPGNN